MAENGEKGTTGRPACIGGALFRRPSNALQHLALLLALRGELNDAARLIGYVNTQYKGLGMERDSTEKWGYEKLMAALHEQLSDAQIEKLAAERAALTEDQAIDEALKI